MQHLQKPDGKSRHGQYGDAAAHEPFVSTDKSVDLTNLGSNLLTIGECGHMLRVRNDDF
jgi:hypothetical protein